MPCGYSQLVAVVQVSLITAHTFSDYYSRDIRAGSEIAARLCAELDCLLIIEVIPLVRPIANNL